MGLMDWIRIKNKVGLRGHPPLIQEGMGEGGDKALSPLRTHRGRIDKGLDGTAWHYRARVYPGYIRDNFFQSIPEVH